MRTKLSVTTCKVLLGMSLAFSGAYAATNVDTNTSVRGNFEKGGNNFTFKGSDYTIDFGATGTKDWDKDTSGTYTQPNLFDKANAAGGGGGADFTNFNADNERITIDAKNNALTLTKSGAGAADTLNNFTLTSSNASGISATGLNFRATSGVSSFNGDTTITGGGLYVDGGSIVVNGDLTLATAPTLGFNADRLSAIQVKGDADLGTLAAGQVKLSSNSIQGFKDVVLVNVTGEDNSGNPYTLTAGLGAAGIVEAVLKVDDRTYLGTNLSSLSGVVGASASSATGGADEGDRVSFADFLKEQGETFEDLLDLSTFTSYTLSTNASANNPTTQLLINGGATSAVLNNANIATAITNILDKYADGAGNGAFAGSGLLYDFASDNDIDLTEADKTKWNAVQKAIDAIENQKARLANLASNTYIENRVVSGVNTPTPLTLATNRAAYDAKEANPAANVEKGMLKYTRNDVFAQNIGNIESKNQNIVARYLDGLEMGLKARTNTAGQAYNQTDLHTQDVGTVARSGVDGDGNAYDNGAVLDAIGRIKLEGIGNTLANQYREGINAIANSNSAISSVNSVINIATDVSIGARVASNNNPYASYAQKMDGLKFAAVASDMGANYVDNYSNGIWANVFGGVNHIGGDNGGIYGLNLGFDKLITDNVLLGAYFTYANSELKYNVLKQESDNFQLGLYSSIQVAPLWELNLKAFGQISPTDQTRYDVLSSGYDSDFTRKTFGLNANIGRSFGFQDDTFIIKPFVGANYYLTYTPGYGENNYGLDMDSTTNNTLSLELGAEFRKYFSENSYFFITPKVEQYVLNSGLDLTPSLNGIAIEDVTDADKKKTYAQAIIGGNFDLSKNFSANVGVGIKQILSGKVDDKSETYGIGQLGIRYKF